MELLRIPLTFTSRIALSLPGAGATSCSERVYDPRVWRGRAVTRIKITVDGNELYEHLDFTQAFKEGHFAFQQHDPGSKVCIRKAEVMPLDE